MLLPNGNEQDLTLRPGVSEETVRLCVGIEHVDDLLADLEQAFGGGLGLGCVVYVRESWLRRWPLRCANARSVASRWAITPLMAIHAVFHTLVLLFGAGKQIRHRKRLICPKVSSTSSATLRCRVY